MAPNERVFQELQNGLRFYLVFLIFNGAISHSKVRFFLNSYSTDQPTNRPTDTASYGGALPRQFLLLDQLIGFDMTSCMAKCDRKENCSNWHCCKSSLRHYIRHSRRLWEIWRLSFHRSNRHACLLLEKKFAQRKSFWYKEGTNRTVTGGSLKNWREIGLNTLNTINSLSSVSVSLNHWRYRSYKLDTIYCTI